MTPDVAVWQLLLPMALLGVANAGMWAPLAATATRNLPMRSAGAGAGIYNTTRQVGAVLGSAAIAAVIEARLAANLGAAAGTAGGSGAGAAAGGTGGTGLPPQVASGFASAMSEAMLLPATVLLLGVVAVLFFVRPSFAGKPATVAAADPTGAGHAPATRRQGSPRPDASGDNPRCPRSHAVPVAAMRDLGRSGACRQTWVWGAVSAFPRLTPSPEAVAVRCAAPTWRRQRRPRR